MNCPACNATLYMPCNIPEHSFTSASTRAIIFCGDTTIAYDRTICHTCNIDYKFTIGSNTITHWLIASNTLRMDGIRESRIIFSNGNDTIFEIEYSDPTPELVDEFKKYALLQ